MWKVLKQYDITKVHFKFIETVNTWLTNTRQKHKQGKVQNTKATSTIMHLSIAVTEQLISHVPQKYTILVIVVKISNQLKLNTTISTFTINKINHVHRIC